MCQLNRGGSDIDDVELVGQGLDDHARVIEIAGQEAFAQRRLRDLEPTGAEIGDGRNRRDLDFLSRRRFHRAEQTVFARLGERNGCAAAAGTARAADAVHVSLGRGWHVVVDDVRQPLDVEPARRDVGRDEQVDLAVAKARHDTVALALFHAAVQRLGAVTVRVEHLHQRIDLEAGAAEDQRRVGILRLEHALERRRLVRAGDDVGDLADARQLCPAASRAMARRVGFFRCRSAIDRMRAGIVAEKSAVWRSRGVASRMASRSSAKPMSSISSASSRIRTSSWPSFSVPRLMWSSARPGVATTTWAPRSSARICCSIGAPP